MRFDLWPVSRSGGAVNWRSLESAHGRCGLEGRHITLDWSSCRADPGVCAPAPQPTRKGLRGLTASSAVRRLGNPHHGSPSWDPRREPSHPLSNLAPFLRLQARESESGSRLTPPASAGKESYEQPLHSVWARLRLHHRVRRSSSRQARVPMVSADAGWAALSCGARTERARDAQGRCGTVATRPARYATEKRRSSGHSLRRMMNLALREPREAPAKAGL